MAMVINTNMGSINGQRKLHDTQNAQSTAMERLSSGLRVNAAKDDAAGLAIADRMNSKIRGMTVAIRNANDGISLVQTAEGALGSMSDTLQRMRDLAVQASSNAGVTQSDRTKMQAEFKQLNDELTRIVQNTEFNGKKVLNGDLKAGLNVQVGANTDTTNQISVKVSDMSAALTNVTGSTLDPAEVLDKALKNDARTSAAFAAKTAADAYAAQAAQTAASKPTDGALDTAAKAAAAYAAQVSSFYTASVESVKVSLTGGTTINANASAVSTANANALAQTITAPANVPASVQALVTTATGTAASQINDTTGAAVTGAAAIAQIIGERDSNGSITTGPVSTAIADLFAAQLNAGTTFDANTSLNDTTKSAAELATARASYIANDTTVLAAGTKADAAAAGFALQSVERIDAAIAQIDTERANLGAVQNRFSTTISNLQSGVENQSAAKSRILDADFASETANLSRAQILQQAGTAMLAQANQSGQSVMTLLR